jgi:hypothetical protein
MCALPAAAQTSFTNATAITITDCPNPCPASGQAASLYPSPITVSGQVGVVQRVSVTFNGFSHAFPADVDFLLVSPSGRKSVLMSDFGAGSPGVSGINVTLDDYAARPVPSTVTPADTLDRRPPGLAAAQLFPDLDATYDAEPRRQYVQPLHLPDGDRHHGQRQRQPTPEPGVGSGGILPGRCGHRALLDGHRGLRQPARCRGLQFGDGGRLQKGTGLAPAAGITTAGQHSWLRKLTTGRPQDTNNNLADFVLVETTAAVLDGVASILGAPGPQCGPTATAYTTTSAPIERNASFTVTTIDPQQTSSAAPNRVRDLTPVTNGVSGTLKIRRKVTNNTGLPVVALRYRVIEITTLTSATVPPGQADIRVLSSPTQTITLTDTSTVTGQALTLQTPAAQDLGGGLNSTLGEGIITTTAPMANGASTVVEFNLGVQTPGNFRFYVTIEALTVPPQ